MKKKSDSKSTIICPCCRKETTPAGAKRVLGRTFPTWGDVRQKVEPELLLSARYQWACDACLQNGKAIMAEPDQQQYVDHPPFLAYFDLQKKCETCGQDYIFSGKEQQYWYETLKFWVQSKPIACAECRRKKREEKMPKASDKPKPDDV